MSITIQSLLTTWGNAFKSGDPTEISKILDENFKHINLHQAEKGFETLRKLSNVVCKRFGNYPKIT